MKNRLPICVSNGTLEIGDYFTTMTLREIIETSMTPEQVAQQEIDTTPDVAEIDWKFVCKNLVTARSKIHGASDYVQSILEDGFITEVLPNGVESELNVIYDKLQSLYNIVESRKTEIRRRLMDNEI